MIWWLYPPNVQKRSLVFGWVCNLFFFFPACIHKRRKCDDNFGYKQYSSVSSPPIHVGPPASLSFLSISFGNHLWKFSMASWILGSHGPFFNSSPVHGIFLLIPRPSDLGSLINMLFHQTVTVPATSCCARLSPAAGAAGEAGRALRLMPV